jgi:hypothetical protein
MRKSFFRITPVNKNRLNLKFNLPARLFSEAAAQTGKLEIGNLRYVSPK